MTAPHMPASHQPAQVGMGNGGPADKPDDSAEKPTNPADPVDHADDDDERVARRAEDLAAREQPQPPLLDDGGAGHGVAKPPVGN